MSTKMDELVKCPYCGKEDFHVFHYGAETLQCTACKKRFAIRLETKISVISAKIFDQKCSVCDSYLFTEDKKEGKCPTCDCEIFEENKYNYSEFDLNHKY